MPESRQVKRARQRQQAKDINKPESAMPRTPRSQWVKNNTLASPEDKEAARRALASFTSFAMISKMNQIDGDK